MDYWPSLLDLLVSGYVRSNQNKYEFRMNISSDIANIILNFHPILPQSDTNTIFKAKSIQYYGKNHLTDSKDTGIVSIAWYDKTVITIDENYIVSVHYWNANTLAIEKRSKLNIFQRLKHKTKISNSNMSKQIVNKNLCFAVTNDCSYIFAAGFEDHSFVLWDIEQSKVIQCVQKHKNIVSCLSFDANILVTGSYDKSLIIWKIYSNQTHKMINEQPIYILDNQTAPVICVDVSLSAGLIVCCLLNGIIKIYNSSTIQQISTANTYIGNQHVYFMYSYFKPTIVRISHAFGHIICHSQETQTLFMLSSNGILVNESESSGDTYYDIKVSKCGKYIICGGREGKIKVKDLPSFKTRKRFNDSINAIQSIYLAETEQHILSGLSSGHVLVYSLPQINCKHPRETTLIELGF